MKKTNGIISAAAMILVSIICMTSSVMADDAISVTDDMEREVILNEKPERVASLLGSFASAWMLAGGELCAATDDAWDDFDLDLSEECVNLGGMQDFSFEVLLETEPDLVLASSKTQEHVDLKDSLEKMGIPVLYFDVSGFEDYLNMLEVFTQITGRDDLYNENGQDIKEQIDQVINRSKEAVNGKEAPRVLSLRVSRTNVRAKGSKGTVLGEMLADLACENIADGSDLLDNLTLEAIIAEDPDYIFVVFQGDDEEAAAAKLEETLISNPAWAGLSAVKSGNIYYMDKHLYNFKPNQLWGEAYEGLYQILYGE